jgi:hypothetical protein
MAALAFASAPDAAPRGDEGGKFGGERLALVCAAAQKSDSFFFNKGPARCTLTNS